MNICFNKQSTTLTSLIKIEMVDWNVSKAKRNDRLQQQQKQDKLKEEETKSKICLIESF
jgi:hypothetical protein